MSPATSRPMNGTKTISQIGAQSTRTATNRVAHGV